MIWTRGSGGAYVLIMVSAGEPSPHVHWASQPPHDKESYMARSWQYFDDREQYLQSRLWFWPRCVTSLSEREAHFNLLCPQKARLCALTGVFWMKNTEFGSITHNPLQHRFKSIALLLLWCCNRPESPPTWIVSDSDAFHEVVLLMFLFCCWFLCLRWFCWEWTFCRLWSADCRSASGRRSERVSFIWKWF